MPGFVSRCSIHGINYPFGVTHCLVEKCGRELDKLSNEEVDSDWREQVEILNALPVEFEDKVPRWRWEQLMAAGYAPAQAEELALRRDVDLHQAVEIAEKASPEVAYEILA